MAKPTADDLIRYIDEHGCSTAEACRKLGISPGTGRSWLKRHRDQVGPLPWDEPAEVVATDDRTAGRVATARGGSGSESRAQGEEEGNRCTVAHDLSAAQAEAVELLANTRMTYAEVSAEVGVDPATLYRWRTTAPFTRALREAIAGRAETIRDELLRVGTGAAQVLAEIAFNEGADLKERRQAAKDLLSILQPRELEVHHSGGVDIRAAVRATITDMSDEELERLAGEEDDS